MVLIRGNPYSIEPSRPAICQKCSRDVADQIRGSLVVYLGVLDGMSHIFFYDQPYQCECGNFIRYHIEQPEFLDVTEEFRTLDKNK